MKKNKYELVELYRKDDFVGSIRTEKNFVYSSRYKKEDFSGGGMMAKGGGVGDKEYKLLPMIPYGVKGYLEPDYKNTIRFKGTEDEATSKAKELAASNPNFVRVEIKREMKTKVVTVGIVDGQNTNYADGGMMAKGGSVGKKFVVGDKVMVDDSGYVKSFVGFDLSQQATVLAVNKVKTSRGIVYTYSIQFEDGKRPYNTALESQLSFVESKMEKGGYMAKKGKLLDNFSDKIQEGDIVWDSGNKRYGIVLNTYDFKYGEIRLDSDGNQPIENLHKLGSEGDKGSKDKLIEALVAHKRLIVEYPDRYEKVNYAKGGGINYELYRNKSMEYVEGEIAHTERSARQFRQSGDEESAKDREAHAKKLWEIYYGKREQSKMADGGEVGKGFYIREMKEKLSKMFPDSFSFTVGNFSTEGNVQKNSSALIVDTNSPFNGLQDSEIKSNLFFPQYKRDHDIRFRIYQGGENTYFYFLLESENGDQYIGQFGFKDEGDVSADYITRFIAFLMEQYGLPFEVKHSVMAKGGYMAGGGVMSTTHRLSK